MIPGTQENRRTEDAAFARGIEGRSRQGAYRSGSYRFPGPCSGRLPRLLVPVNQVANVTLVDSRTIGVQPWEKMICRRSKGHPRDSDLGLNPGCPGRSHPRADARPDGRAAQRERDQGRQARGRNRQGWRSATCAATPSPTGDALEEARNSGDDERRAQDDMQLTDCMSPKSTRCWPKEKDLMQV